MGLLVFAIEFVMSSGTLSYDDKLYEVGDGGGAQHISA